MKKLICFLATALFCVILFSCAGALNSIEEGDIALTINAPASIARASSSSGTNETDYTLKLSYTIKGNTTTKTSKVSPSASSYKISLKKLPINQSATFNAVLYDDTGTPCATGNSVTTFTRVNSNVKITLNKVITDEQVMATENLEEVTTDPTTATETVSINTTTGSTTSVSYEYEIQGNIGTATTGTTQSTSTYTGINIAGYYNKIITSSYNSNGWRWYIGDDSTEATFDTDTKTATSSDKTLTLKVEPKIMKGVSTDTYYIVIEQTLTNISSETKTDLKFASCCDIQIYETDKASVIYDKSYGITMTDGTYSFNLFCTDSSLKGVTAVDTLWVGEFGTLTITNGQKKYTNLYTTKIYQDQRISIPEAGVIDSAACYSWQGITLEAGESITKSVRMTVVKK